MRRTKEEAEQTRQTVLNVAIKVFSQQGYTATRLEDIAEAAGVTRGAVYHHFESKASLFAEIIEQASQSGNQVIQRAIQQGGTFLEIVQRILEFTIELLETDQRFRSAMALLLFNSGDSPELVSMRSERVKQGKVTVNEVAGFFQMALGQNAVRADLDPQIASRAFIAYQNGLVMMWLSSPGLIDRKKHAAGLAELFVYGIAPKA